jgi:hypothetical protein
VTSTHWTSGSKIDRREGKVSVSHPATWVLIWTAVLLSRFYWSPLYLSTDTVNLAYALESFNPKLHQPQPPGYPLFVAIARLIYWFVSSPEVTFWIISILVTIASAAILYRLADRMISRWAAMAVVILFLLNPVLWFSRLRSPLRPWLALFSALIAYCAWRCWNGERRFVWWGALALGLGTGFRLDLLAYLFPLWAVSAWKATRSWKRVIQGSAIVVALSSSWLGVVVYAMGGIRSSIEVFANYVTEQSSKDSILFASSRIWFRPISRLLLWNATAIVGWFWVPIILYRRTIKKDSRWPFLLIWVVPGLIVQLLFHIAAPGHTLFATPAWCVMGAYFVSQSGRHRDAVLALSASISAALFLNIVPAGYPPAQDAAPLERAWISVKNSIAFGTFETSLERLRWWDEMSEVSIQELSRLSVTDRPNLVVVLNGNDQEFDFVNWRVVSYYLNDRPLWVLLDNLAPGVTGRVRHVRGKDIRFLTEQSIPIPRSARILWVMLPEGRFHRALEKVMPVHRGRYILYTDPPYTTPFQIEGFEFIPF